ncbi:MAG TPA: DUF6531 domain-containing protein, partial [Thermoanaerobaculia bacterium]
AAADHTVAGKAIPFSLARTYRSGTLGYGPLGSAGWSASLFAHLRELPVSGEVEYHDGQGHVWRFYPRSLPAPPEGTEADESGSYSVPAGLYLRLQKLPGDLGFRLIGREHDVALFDGMGRLIEISDRHRRGGTEGDQGSRLQLHYDPFGQLESVLDDLGRRYRFTYHDDPRPEAQGGDGARYGLLKSVKDFVDREVAYEFDADRRLVKVKLPEVENQDAAYTAFSYKGDARPTLEYHYDPPDGVTTDELASGALLHGKFAKLRLSDFLLPDFVDGVSRVPRAIFSYETETGRLSRVGFPRPDNNNSAGSTVAWSFFWPQAFPVDHATVQAPWGHEVDHTLEKGRVKTRREDLKVYRASQAPADESVVTTFSYADDGRLLSVDRPDSSRLSQCYADGKGGPGCASSDSSGKDRLAKGNVVSSQVHALTPEAQGTADYDTTETQASYQEDNQAASLKDGEGRAINLAVPQAGQSDVTRFAAEQVSAHFDFDRYGRVKQATGGDSQSTVVHLGYRDDAQGKPEAGPVSRIERGSAFWQDLSYDKAFNVEKVKTSQGTESHVDHDAWDRAVREVSGLSQDGRFVPVGVTSCSEGDGAIVERAFDAAGHVVRERRLQDYVDPRDGADHCRWVETTYTYNVREQLVSVAQTHLASATTPGQVVDASQPVTVLEYDDTGRLATERSRVLTRPDLLKTYAYDPAGRVASVRTGEEGARQLGYDALSRVVFTTDGDEGVWQGRYDAWGRLFHEQQPTGAVVRRRFDRAGNPVQEKVYDADPTIQLTAQVLSDVSSHVTSFGAVDRVAETLTAATGQAPAEKRVTEKVFDDTGRVKEVWSGPPASPNDDPLVDRSRGRREVAVDYEPETGRLQTKRYGGDTAMPARHAVTYSYQTENQSPWPDTVTLLESVPGQTDLTTTLSTAYR